MRHWRGQIDYRWWDARTQRTLHSSVSRGKNVRRTEGPLSQLSGNVEAWQTAGSPRDVGQDRFNYKLVGELLSKGLHFLKPFVWGWSKMNTWSHLKAPKGRGFLFWCDLIVFPAKTKGQGRVERRVVLNGYQVSQMHWYKMFFYLKLAPTTTNTIVGIN